MSGADRAGRRARNDPAQYDTLADQWWEPSGGFAALHWLAASRAEHIPPADRPGSVLVDLACGGGLMAPHVDRLGYRHVGVDIGLSGLLLARGHGMTPVRGSVLAVPLADGCADVVVAGEILEHVEDHVGVLAECARLLKPGGTLVIDALAAGRLSVLINVHLFERLPGGPPRGLHDPALFVDRKLLLAAADRLGLDLELVGLRPSIREAIAWKLGRRDLVRMKPIRSTAVVFAGYGRKRRETTASPDGHGARAARTVEDMTPSPRAAQAQP
ncbi:2-polyprenyl-6-hydroxyphenyl methylase / 3-demethylubiquinone-9 3-methyltransferase [Blastococcus aggregatus]|uniref:2-polyprenyl-6-hydroxyphenyl methylase / 3-demethylubiquinone-9 3-methyltransferase n=1 Tax=Blastococcus aggregatus TaxID=38502 RepID=A0A285VC23_9ACTN|nr:methyltransferase domain-containing protein [Blastococcus aggregatus]SOC51665.1 2-polyprenyl-6-hydroxyphenyl methylase / 3-demethylubiquinone-9 3-methyltransferase [Blastococcus aggregatus]